MTWYLEDFTWVMELLEKIFGPLFLLLCRLSWIYSPFSFQRTKLWVCTDYFWSWVLLISLEIWAFLGKLVIERCNVSVKYWMYRSGDGFLHKRHRYWSLKKFTVMSCYNSFTHHQGYYSLWLWFGTALFKVSFLIWQFLLNKYKCTSSAW